MRGCLLRARFLGLRRGKCFSKFQGTSKHRWAGNWLVPNMQEASRTLQELCASARCCSVPARPARSNDSCLRPGQRSNGDRRTSRQRLNPWQVEGRATVGCGCPWESGRPPPATTTRTRASRSSIKVDNAKTSQKCKEKIHTGSATSGSWLCNM